MNGGISSDGPGNICPALLNMRTRLLLGRIPRRLLSVANRVPPAYANPPIAPNTVSLAAVGSPGGVVEVVGVQFVVCPAGQGASAFTPPEFCAVKVGWPMTARAACPVVKTWALAIPANKLIDSDIKAKTFCMSDD